MSVYYEGTYELVETRIHVDLDVARITVGGLDPVEGMVEYLKALLPVLAEIQGISEDDYPAYEEDALAEFRESFDVEDMKEDMALDLDTLGTYELKEGVLAITTDPEEGFEQETILLERVDESSAVRAVTWGQLKSPVVKKRNGPVKPGPWLRMSRMRKPGFEIVKKKKDVHPVTEL